LRVWDLETGVELKKVRWPWHDITAAFVLPDSSHALFASRDGMLRMWDVDNEREVFSLKAHTDAIEAMAVAQNSRMVVTASADHTARVWDLDKKTAIAAFVADTELCSCSISPDARSIVAGDEVGCVHFLRLEGLDG